MSSWWVKKPDGYGAIVRVKRTNRDRRRERLEFLTDRQVHDIRRDITAAEARCGDTYQPLADEVIRLHHHYGVKMATIVRISNGE